MKNDNAPFFGMPNDMKPTDYKQTFVRAPESLYPRETTNTAAKQCPSAERVLNEVNKGKC